MVFLRKLLFSFSIFIAIFLFLPRGVFAGNLLLNSSFENIENGVPISWTKNVSTITLSVSNNAKAGTASVSLNKTNNTTGLISLYQDVDVEPESFYSLSGYAVKNSPNFNWIILRISWRSANGEISKTDSYQLMSDSLDFQLLKIESVQAPTQAIKARIQLAANIVTPNPANPALFDDINFSQISPPDQPVSTLSSTLTTTSISTSSPAIKDYNNIFISEYMPYPESGDEWVELYNSNGFEVNLNGWYIDDIDDIDDSGSAPKLISGTISAKGYKQFYLSSAYLNNGGDDVRFLNGNQNEKDKTSFESSTKGKSWAKDKNGNWCQVEPTPNEINLDCPNPGVDSAPTPIPTPTSSLTPTPKQTAIPSLTPKPTVKTASQSGEILGEETATFSAFYPYEATSEAKENEATSSARNKIWPKIFLLFGLVLIFSGAFFGWRKLCYNYS